jgi:hypothetical protein
VSTLRRGHGRIWCRSAAEYRRVRLIRFVRFIGVVFIVVGLLTLLVAAFLGYFFSTVGTFGSHQGPSQKPLPLLFSVEVGEAGIVTIALVAVGIGLIRLKPWARIGAILFGALGLYFSVVAFITFYFETTPLPKAMPEPPLAMIVVAAIFPPGTLISALLAVFFIVMLLTRRGRAVFVSGREKAQSKIEDNADS